MMFFAGHSRRAGGDQDRSEVLQKRRADEALSELSAGWFDFDKRAQISPFLCTEPLKTVLISTSSKSIP